MVFLTPEERAARQQLAERIRSDWSYPPASSQSSSRKASPGYPDEAARGIPLSDLLSQGYAALVLEDITPTTQNDDYPIPERRVVSWQERTMATSDMSANEQEDERAIQRAKHRVPEIDKSSLSSSFSIGGGSLGRALKLRSKEKLKSVRKRLSLTDDTMASSPGAHAEAAKVDEEQAQRVEEAEKRRHARKRRRMEDLQDEMRWNEGLDFWVKRRDAWCCAKSARLEHGDDSGKEREADTKIINHPLDRATLQRQSADAITVADPQAPDSTPRSHREQNRISTSSSNTATSSTVSTSTNLTAPFTPPSTASPAPLDDAHKTTLIPRTIPILAETDPGRASLDPRIYTSIYSKVILQSITPSIPINLSHVIGALVAGWKRDGEWHSSSASLPTPSQVYRSNGKSAADRESEKRKAARRKDGKREVSTGSSFAPLIERGGRRNSGPLRGSGGTAGSQTMKEEDASNSKMQPQTPLAAPEPAHEAAPPAREPSSVEAPEEAPEDSPAQTQLTTQQTVESTGPEPASPTPAHRIFSRQDGSVPPSSYHRPRRSVEPHPPTEAEMRAEANAEPTLRGILVRPRTRSPSAPTPSDLHDEVSDDARLDVSIKQHDSPSGLSLSIASRAQASATIASETLTRSCCEIDTAELGAGLSLWARELVGSDRPAERAVGEDAPAVNVADAAEDPQVHGQV